MSPPREVLRLLTREWAISVELPIYGMGDLPSVNFVIVLTPSKGVFVFLGIWAASVIRYSTTKSAFLDIHEIS